MVSTPERSSGRSKRPSPVLSRSPCRWAFHCIRTVCSLTFTRSCSISPTHCSGIGAILRSSSQLIGERRTHRLAAVALPLGSQLLAHQAHSCHLCRSIATALASASALTLQHHMHTGSLQVHLSLPSARASCRAHAHITILRLALCSHSIAASVPSDHTHVLARNACSGNTDSLSSGAE